MRRILAQWLGVLAMLPGVATAQQAPPLDAAFGKAQAVVRDAGLPGELVITDVAGPSRAAAFGRADREAGVANRVGQRWLWASVTKQVTATLVLQEVGKGRMALDAPIGQYLPKFGGDRAITVRQLLQHRSGLPNPSDKLAADGTIVFYSETGPGIGDAARAEGFCAGPAKGPAGGAWEYNNCDYLVLGAALEAVTGQSFARLMAERIGKPLGMRRLRLAPDGAARGGAAAQGYAEGKPVRSMNAATGGAAAALSGSADDLARFDRALMAGRLLPPALREQAWTGDPQLGYMALGVWSFPAGLRGCKDPVRLIERRGDFAGTQVRNVIAPKLGRAVIVFTNDAAADFGEIWQGRGLSYDVLSAALCP